MRFLLFILLLSLPRFLLAQDAPNLANMAPPSGNAGQESKFGSMPVNLYTGMPSVSVPVYNYTNAGSGLTWPVSLSYFAGGIQVGEAASTVGLGWNFNGSGAVTRTVRGMPDDLPTKGFLYSSAIPTDFRSNGSKYATDSLDGQQDVFQFSFKDRSGQFLIGKNKQIVQIPMTKMKISYQVSTLDNSSIVSFRVVAEDGTVYDFANEETTTITGGSGFNFGYSGLSYGSSWWLTDVIAPFGTDTIRFNYITHTVPSLVSFPQFTYHNDGTGAPLITSSTASATISVSNLSSIVFPDKKTLQVIYSFVYKYDGIGGAISKIKICDSIFRYGYALGYNNPVNGNFYLSSVTPYTSHQEQDGYKFTYNIPTAGSPFAKDFWGLYNGVLANQNLIPVQGSNTYEAIRTPNITYATANTLTQYYQPGEGYVGFAYELNDHYPLLKAVNSLAVDGTVGSSQAAASFSQVLGTKQKVVINVDPSVSRNGLAPISGSGLITLAVKSTNGVTQYASTTISLYDLFDLGSMTWQFNLPNGSYLITSLLSGGTIVGGSFPLDLSWENRSTDNSTSAVTSGGLRVKRIQRGDQVDNIVLTEDFQYLTEDGKSSGILGDIPNYTHPYSETVINGGTTTTNYTFVSSDPVGTQDFTQGSPVGYSRVLVYKGSSTHNLGKTVYEFTGPADVNCNLSTSIFPYTPQDIRSWGLGLPARTSVYDSSSNLVKRTVNTFRFDTVAYTTSDFLSLQLGNLSTKVNGDPTNPSTPRLKTYIGQQYYPSSGHVCILSTNDTLYQSNGSINTSFRNYLYDTNYNVIKTTTSFNRTRGLQLEMRYYYPYNYVLGGVIGTFRTAGILTPVISTENWITGDGNPRIVGGSITDYQQLASGYVKPLTSYALQTSAPVIQTTIGLFDSSRLNRNSTYFVAQASYPSYSNKGNLLQETNAVTSQSYAIIRDYNDEYSIAKVSNAAYSDVAYTSFESDGSGNWTIGSTLRDNSGALTGKAAYNLANGTIARSGLNASQTYNVSLWAKTSANVSVNGTPQFSPIATQNGWNLYFTTVSGVASVTISGNGIIDELRLYPKDANMSTTTYEPMVGAIAFCDLNNTVGYTSYDLLNRPKLIRDMDLNIVKRYDYADKDSLISILPVLNRAAAFQWDPNFTCGFDSIITIVDQNPWSDTYNQTTINTVFEGYNYCTCSQSANYPQYKTIGGQCTQGVKQYSSCILHAGLYQCTYHYIWPDCSVSGNFNENDATAQTVTSGCPGGSP